jgi:hypothetical protein
MTGKEETWETEERGTCIGNNACFKLLMYGIAPQYCIALGCLPASFDILRLRTEEVAGGIV